MTDIDKLSNLIRTVDGAHALGAGALAEAIIDSKWLAEHDKQVRIQTLKDFAFGARCESDYKYLNEGVQYLEKEE